MARFFKNKPGAGKQAYQRRIKQKQQCLRQRLRDKQQQIAKEPLAWRSMIDLQHQHLGADAYDKGVNRNHELGEAHTFIGNVQAASAYAAIKLIDDKAALSWTLYDEIHRRCLAGITAEEGAENPLQLRNSSQAEASYGFKAGSLAFLDPETIARAIPNKIALEQEYQSELLDGMKICDDYNKPNLMYPLTYGQSIAAAKMWLTRQQVEQLVKKNLNDSPDTFKGGIPVEFPPMRPEAIKQTINAYFKNYNYHIAKIHDSDQAWAQKREAVLEQIGSLFQKLERLHPYPDGNGRVNQVLLQTLLQKEGFPRAILDDPSCSHLISSKQMLQALKKGISRSKCIEYFSDSEAKVSQALMAFDDHWQTAREFRYVESDQLQQDKTITLTL